MKHENMTEWVERLRMAATKAVTENDMQEIFRGLVKQAKRGDQAAIKMLMTYLQPPPPAPEPHVAPPPAQRVTAKTVNIYAGGNKKRKLLTDAVKMIPHENGRS